MGVTPVSISRVSHNMRAQMLINGVQKTMVDLLKRQEQLASGLRIVRPSDDPIGASAAIRLDDLLEAQQQYLSNMDYASSCMNLADSTVGSIHDLLVEAHELALSNIGSDTSTEARSAAATLVDSIIDQIFTLGNSEYLGSYLFAGNRNTVAPFARDGSLVKFLGNDEYFNIQVADDIAERINLTAGEVFGTGSGLVTSDHDLEAAATSTTRLTDISGTLGKGIRTGTLVIVGSVIGTVDVDLTGAHTLGDVIETVNEALPASVTMTLEADGRTLKVQSANAGETLQIIESGQGTIARDLGVYTNVAVAGAITGDDFAPKLTLQTSVSALSQNGGIDLTSGMIVTNGADTGTLDFSTAETVQDILNTINAAGLGLEARINDDATGIDIINLLAGAELTIGENGGTTAADLGVRTLGGDTLLADLNSGRGVNPVTGDDFRIVTSDGTEIDVDISTATTIQDVIDLINAAAGADLTASLASSGNGIVLTDNTGGAGTFEVQRLNLSNAAKELGILKTASGGSDVITGDDVNPTKELSVFSCLIDLRDALLADDTRAIEQAGADLEDRLDEVTRYHGKLGFMAKGLQTRRDRTEDAVLSTQALLSNIRDVDYTEAITAFQNLQTTLQASLAAGGQILNISLLDFLK